jgi:oligoribonuclease (3'-5' exoribonuclease)
MDINQLGGDSAAAPALAALAAAKWRKARDLAKELCKKDRARYLVLLIEANVGLAREMQAKGLTKDAEPVLAYLKTICPPDQWDALRQELEKAPPAMAPTTSRVEADTNSASPAALLAIHWPTVLNAAEACEKGLPVTAAEWAAVDVVVGTLAPLPVQEPGSLGELVAAELTVIRLACTATAEGRWEDAQIGLRSLARQSVFQHWRMFLRGVRHHFLREVEPARRCFTTLPADSGLARAAAVIAGSAAVPGTTRQAPARARADWWLAVSGQPRTLAAAIAEAHITWMKPDVRQTYELLSKAFGKDFPTVQPTLAGLMTAVIMPVSTPRSESEEKRDKQWSQLQRVLMHQSNQAQITCSILRALALRDAADMNPHDLFEEWRAMLALQTKLLGTNALRDSVGWLWLAEQMMLPPQNFGYFGYFGKRSKSPHQHSEHARTALMNAIRSDPEHEAAHLALLHFYNERNETSERNKLLDELVKRFPANKQVLIQTGSLAADRKAFTKALPSLRAARALDPLDRLAQTALTAALIHQVRDLLKKKRPMEAMAAIWEEIETLALDAAGPYHLTLARWTHRVRRAVLEGSDTYAAEAAKLAPSAIQALFFERLLVSLYDGNERLAWKKAWKAALAANPGWRELTALVDTARVACQMKGYGFDEKFLAEQHLNEVFTQVTTQHLLSDPDGILHFIQHTDTSRWNDLEYTGLSSIIFDQRYALSRKLSPYAGKPASHPQQCFASLLLESEEDYFQLTNRFVKQLAAVIDTAQKTGLTTLHEAAQRLQTQLHEKWTRGDEEDDFDDEVDDIFPPPSGTEQLTEADLQAVPLDVLPLIVELGFACQEGRTHVIAELRARALAAGMSGELFDKFVRTAPGPQPKPSGKQRSKPQHPELDLF